MQNLAVSSQNSQKKLNAWDIQRMVFGTPKDRLSSTERLVLLVLIDHYPTMRPGVKRISAMSGLGESTIREVIGRLKKKRAIFVESVFLQPNIYHINVDFFSHLTIVPPAGDAPPPPESGPPPLQNLAPPPPESGAKGINIKKEKEKNIGDSQSNTTSSRDQEEEDPSRSTKKGNPQIETFSAAKMEGMEGGKEREQTEIGRMIIETEEIEFAVIKKSFEREEKKEKARRKEIIGDENKCDKIKEKAIAFGDAFFAEYPKKDGEIGARDLIEQMWRNGRINKDNWKSILDAVENQKYGGILAKFDRFIPLAKNWLRDGRWLDKPKPTRKSTKSKTKKHMVGEYNAERANKRPRVGWGDEDEKPKKKKHMVGEYDPERAKKWPGFGWGDYDPSKPKKKHMVGEYDPELDGSTKIGW
jgi:hypothetical protein